MNEQYRQDGVMTIVEDEWGDFVRQDKYEDGGIKHYDYFGNYTGGNWNGTEYDASGNPKYDD